MSRDHGTTRFGRPARSSVSPIAGGHIVMRELDDQSAICYAWRAGTKSLGRREPIRFMIFGINALSSL
ncbi:MAG: hypothetical protein D6795_06235 [Deltaproteobacteria bacterium]|nr:MAG: hypothetical protein D6795_06235 [Deltaproteobacteria bacterium]